MNIVSVAVGKQYELEVQRLLTHYPQTILITERTEGVETSFSIPVLNGLATKCKFGLLIPKDLQGPIIFCDADLYPVVEDPLKHFKVKEGTDIAYVIYPGKWHFPKRLEKYQQAISKTGKINSGFMYFRNIDICRDVCSKWYGEYLRRMNEYGDSGIGEYDEPSLVFVLYNENYNLEFLDRRWNTWNTSDCPKEEAYFVQSHLNNWSPYVFTPGFRNEAWKDLD